MKTLTFKVTDDEARSIRALARRERVTVSEFLRRRASLPNSESRDIQRVKCPVTDAMIFAPLSGQPQLTTEGVAELLADFP